VLNIKGVLWKIIVDLKDQLTADVIAKVAAGRISIINAAKLLNKPR